MTMTKGLNFEAGQIIEFTYTNYRGEVDRRRVEVVRLWVGETEFHPGRQVLITAIDVARGVRREFAFKDIVFDV